MKTTLVNFAKEISQASPNELPSKFVQLERLIFRSSASTALKYEIISFEILPVLLLTIRQDFNIVDDGWNIAALNLTPLASSCLCLPIERNDPRLKERSTTFLEKYLPQGVESFIILSRNLLGQYSAEKQGTVRKTLLGCINSVMKHLIDVLSSHNNRETLFKQVLASTKFIEMFLSDDIRICSIMIQSLRDILDHSRAGRSANAFAGLSRKLKEDYVNELVYKLFIFDNPAIGKESAQTLLIMCDIDSTVSSILSRNFKALPTILQRYSVEEMGSELRDLLRILRGGKVSKAYSREIKSEEDAALKIQKVWRGYRERKRLSKATEGIRKFQISFRKRKRREEREKEEQRERAELQYHANLRHIRCLREYKLQQIRTIELLPASQVEKFLEVQNVESATKIQAFFRGYLQRKRMDNGGRNLLIAEQAARKIQRNFRKYLLKKREEVDRRLKRLEYIKPSILTEAKREEIIEHIETWKRQRAPRPLSDKDFEELYEQGQKKITEYVRTNRAWRRVEQRQRALLHMVDNDTDLLISNYGKMKTAMEPGHETRNPRMKLDEVNRLLTHPSSAIRYRARQDHLDSLRYVRTPWYRSLKGDDVDENDFSELDDDDLKRFGLAEVRRNDILSNPTRYEYEKRKFYIFEPNLTAQSTQRSQ